MAALHIRLKPGWKTYWRAPGESGIPPQFTWAGSDNLAAVKFHWPRPKVHYDNGMRLITYKDQVVIPVEFFPKTKGEPLSLRAKANLGVCRDICMPVSLDFSAKLSALITRPDPAIRDALKKRPLSAKQAGVKGVSCLVEPISDGVRLTATLKMPSTGKDEIVVVETADQEVWVAPTEARRSGAALVAVTDLVGPSNAPFALERSKLRFTVMGSKTAVDIQGCSGP